MKTSSLRKGPGRGCDLGAGDPTPARHRKAKRPVAGPPPPHLTLPALNRYASPTGETGGPVQIYKNHIDGEWVDAASGRTLDVINPATREVIARVPDSGAADVDRAVQAARRAFDRDGWPRTSARERGRILFRLAEYVRKHGTRFAEIETTNNGKPIAEAQADVADAAFCFEYYGGLATKIRGDVLTVPDNAMALALKEPLGVAGMIVPWNYPLMMAVQKVAAALAAGCTSVLKPASQTPLSVIELAKGFEECGVPRGVINVVNGGGRTVGMPIVTHPGVDKIAFTGSSEVGKLIMREAAATVKRVSLELGGKSPNIFFADADLPAAVRGAQNGIFYGKGEVCAAGSRLLVEQTVHDQVLEQLAERVKKLTPGDPFDKNTRLGAILSQRQQETVLSYIAAGEKEGARLVAGGKPAKVNGKGYYVEATGFDGAQPGMKIVDEEIFGPVLSVLTFANAAEGIQLANRSMYGLAAGIWTKDIQKAHRVARAIKAGTVWINTYNFYDPAAPFGGYKFSGFGRDLGKEALDNYTELKTVWGAL